MGIFKIIKTNKKQREQSEAISTDLNGTPCDTATISKVKKSMLTDCHRQVFISTASTIAIVTLIWLTAPISHHVPGLAMAIALVVGVAIARCILKYYGSYWKFQSRIKKYGMTKISGTVVNDTTKVRRGQERPILKTDSGEVTVTYYIKSKDIIAGVEYNAYKSDDFIVGLFKQVETSEQKDKEPSVDKA